MNFAISPDVTSIFLYSPREEHCRDGGRLPRLSYAGPDGTKTAYTKEIAAGLPDADAKIAEYLGQHPDARIVGYGSIETQHFSAPPPRLASLTP